MKRINWYGAIMMIFGISISIVKIDDWFGGMLFGAGLVYLMYPNEGISEEKK